MSKECLWLPRALPHSIKARAPPGPASCSLASLSSRNKVSLSPLHLSLWAEMLSWWLLRWILGLPQLGPAREQFKGCHLLSLLVGVAEEGWEEGVSFKQKGINGAELQGSLPTRLCTCSRWSLTKWPSASSAFLNAAMFVLEMGYDQSFPRCFKPTVLAPIPKVGQPSCAVQLGGHSEGRGRCRHTGNSETKVCPRRELRKRRTD